MTRKFLVPVQLPADPANPLEAATKQYVDAHGVVARSVIAVSSDRALALTDKDNILTVSDATLTVPTDATVAFPVPTQIDIVCVVPNVSVVEAGGVTVTTAATLNLRTEGSAATLVKLAANTWVLVGDLEAAAMMMMASMVSFQSSPENPGSDVQEAIEANNRQIGDEVWIGDVEPTIKSPITMYLADGSDYTTAAPQLWLDVSDPENAVIKYLNPADNATWLLLPTGGGSGLPAGGTTGQALGKFNDDDGVVTWLTVELVSRLGCTWDGANWSTTFDTGSNDRSVEDGMWYHDTKVYNSAGGTTIPDEPVAVAMFWGDLAATMSPIIDVATYGAPTKAFIDGILTAGEVWYRYDSGGDQWHFSATPQSTSPPTKWPDPNPTVYADQRLFLPNPSDYPGSEPGWDAGQLPSARLRNNGGDNWDGLPPYFGSSKQGLWFTEAGIMGVGPPGSATHVGVMLFIDPQIFLPGSNGRDIKAQLWIDSVTADMYLRTGVVTSSVLSWGAWKSMSPSPPSSFTQGVVTKGSNWNSFQKPGYYTVEYFEAAEGGYAAPPVGQWGQRGLLHVLQGGVSAGEEQRTIQIWMPDNGVYLVRYGDFEAPNSVYFAGDWERLGASIEGVIDQYSTWSSYTKTGIYTTSIVSTPSSYKAPPDAANATGQLQVTSVYDIVLETWTQIRQTWTAVVAGVPVMWFKHAADSAAFPDSPWVKVATV